MEDIFLKGVPSIDLHGYDRDSAVVITNDFITENLILNNKTLVIIHGIGEGILKKEVHDCLLRNKQVMKFYVHPFNPGCTVVFLK